MLLQLAVTSNSSKQNVSAKTAGVYRHLVNVSTLEII